MTISSTTRKAGPFIGNGVTTVFPFGFKIFAKTDVELQLIDSNGTSTTLTLDSDYSVTLNPNQTDAPGGTITYPITGSALPSPYKLVVLGDLPIEQQTDITNSGGFYPEIIEDMVDRATIQIQQVAEVVSRAIVVGASDTSTAELPSSAARANTILGFDALGNLETLPITASVGAGDMRTDTFTSGIDFTSGVSNSLVLSRAPGSLANIEVFFDAAYQGPENFQSLTGAVLTFTAAIPVGVQRVYVRGGSALSIYLPSTGSVFDASVAAGTKLLNRINFIANAKDAPFNAIGDGVSNDTIAFQAICNSTAAGQVLDVDVPAGSYYLATNVAAGAGTVNWRFASGASLTGPGKLAHHAATMAYNSTPNVGKRHSIWHGTDANPTTDGVTATSYTQRVDQSVVGDDAAHLIFLKYNALKRAAGGTGWLTTNYNYLEDHSTSGAAQSVALSGSAHGITAGAIWGLYSEAWAHNHNVTATSFEHDTFNYSGSDYVYNDAFPTTAPFTCGDWNISFGPNKNTFASGIASGSVANMWRTGIYMKTFSIDHIGIDIQAQPATLINFKYGASTDGTGITPGGIGLDVGPQASAAYGAAANQCAIHMRDQRLGFGSFSFFQFNAAQNKIELWVYNGSTFDRRGYFDLTAADHAF